MHASVLIYNNGIKQNGSAISYVNIGNGRLKIFTVQQNYPNDLRIVMKVKLFQSWKK